MNTVLLFAVLGASTGAIYALGSVGIVLTYRGTGVINFASNAMGMMGGFLFYQLADVWHWPVAIAFILGVGLAGLAGWLTYLCTIPLKAASNLTKIVLTLALLVVITGAVGLVYAPENSYSVASVLPTNSIPLFGEHIGENDLLLLGICVVLIFAATLFYRRTRFGLATSAVAENDLGLATLGWSPGRIAGINWALGAALAGVATILISPVTGLTVGLATTLLLPCLGAAVLGNLTSFPIALGGGLLIGIIQAELQRYVSFSGFGDAVPFGVILVYLVVRGRNLPSAATCSNGYHE